jgi:hypothetical protein
MRILRNYIKVYGYDELCLKAKLKAVKYINFRKKEFKKLNKVYNFSVNDFEWFENGKIMFHTNNIDAF